MLTSGPVRLAVVGGRRGAAFNAVIDSMPERASLVAICDTDEAVLAEWRRTRPQIATYEAYDDLLEAQVADAVIIATPAPAHAQQAIQALEAGYHVLSEVYAADTLDDCWALVETVERTGLTYMMAENCCYTRSNLLVLNLVQHGLFGDPTYAECAYIHDCRALILDGDGRLTWRGELYRREQYGNWYPTHSIGPVAQWLGINRTDRFVSAATFWTRPEGAWRYVRDRFGPEHPLASPAAMSNRDSVTTMVATERGAVVVLRLDVASPRPANNLYYALQGTRGAYLSPRHHTEPHLVWIEGMSPGDSPSGTAEWQDLEELAAEFEHPLWAEHGEKASQLAHGGADYFVVPEFLDAVISGGKPPIDVYDAVTWSCFVPLTAMSAAQGGVPVDVPNFAISRKP